MRSAPEAGGVRGLRALPGPAAPVVVQTARWMLSPYALLDECARRYGDPFRIDIAGWGRLVLVRDAEEIRKIFLADPELLRTGETNDIIEPLLGSRGLFTLDGARHRQRRRLLQPRFSGSQLTAHLDTVRAVADRVVAGLPRSQPFRMLDHAQRIALESILWALFSSRDEGLADRFQGALHPLLGIVGSAIAYFRFLQRDLGPLSPGHWARRRLRHLDALVHEQIRRRREGGGLHDDVLQTLLTTKDERGDPLSDEEIRDHLVTLMVAGHDTVATAVAWVFHWLPRHHEILERLTAEVRGARDKPTTELLELELLDAVCCESLRIRPVIEIVSRKNREPLELLGCHVPAGCLVSPCMYLASRNPDLFPEPDAFRPERFLGARVTPYAFFPFGGGARHCLGHAMAVQEMKVTIASVLSRFSVRSASSRRVVGSVRRNVTIAPADGARVVVD